MVAVFGQNLFKIQFKSFSDILGGFGSGNNNSTTTPTTTSTATPTSLPTTNVNSKNDNAFMDLLYNGRNAIARVGQGLAKTGLGKITSKMGWRTIFGGKDYHEGIDTVNLAGKKVHALFDQKVVAVGNDKEGGGGFYVKSEITLPSGEKAFITQMHFAKDPRTSHGIKVGQVLAAGTELGEEGSTGRSTGRHSDTRIYKEVNGKREWINPQEIDWKKVAQNNSGNPSTVAIT